MTNDEQPPDTDAPDENDNEMDDETLITKITEFVHGVVEDLRTVRVITVVADTQVEVVKDEHSDKRTIAHVEMPGKHAAFVTEIDLADGDVMTVLPTDYESHPEVQALHEKTAEKATSVFIDNLESVVNAASAIIRAIRRG